MLLLIARSLMLLLPHIILFLHLLSASSSQGFDFNKPCQMMRYQAVFNGGFIPLCNPSGEWRELQCHQNECWCVVAETGEEIPNTKGPSALKPDCSYGAAIGALELDMIPLIASNMGNDIKRIDEAFISRPAYRFNPSPNIYLPMKKYMPPSLWQEFSILATVKPKTLEGGFLFAIMDKLESVVQFGLSISAGENDYTQYINVWFTEDLQQDENGTNYSGSQKLTSFVIPRMVDRWSRFAISITQTSADLYVYCHNYTMEELPLRKPLDFLPESLLLVGHAGSGIQQSFEGEILELLVTSDPNDAAKQCDAAFEAERQQSASETELEYLLEGSGLTGNLDTELDDESDGSLVSSGDDSEEFQYPSRNGRMDEDVTIGMLVIPATADSVKSATRSTLSIGLTDPLVKSLEKTTAKYDVNDPVDYAGPVKMKGMQGEKGDRGDPGPPGSPGVNGIPGVEGAVGVQGLQGPKGENGDIGQGSPGEKGEKGEKGKGHKGVRGDTGPKGEQGDSIVGPPGYPGRSFLEELRLLDRSGQSEARSELDGFIRSLPNLTGQKGESGNCTEKIGPSGRDGLDGIPGRAGPPGLPGPAGAVGRDGTNGRQGDKGESGDKGAHGKVGLQGERGHPGAPGETGPAGPPGKLVNMHGEAVTSVTAGEPGGPGEKGETGERGQKGAIGEPGHRGHKGEIGAKGEPGISGTPGFPGKTGLPGIEGESGVPGGRGNKGEKGDVGVGLPGPPGPPGSASRGFSLSDEDSLTKIKGEKGEAGIPGRVDPDELRRLIPLLVEQGDKGERGPVGASPMCQPCLDTTGSKGPRGPRGYPGSHGRHGQKGNIGMPGFPGLDGIPGRDGKPGLTVRGPKGQAGSCDVSTCQGTRGDQGFAGLPGIPGRDGIPGLRGLSGENGAKGEPGAPGVVTTVDGVYIVPGPPGQPGPPGPSVTGPPGPQGPRGFPGSGGLSNLNLGTTLPGGVKRTDGGVLLFTTTKEMSQSSLAIPVGTLAFVSESQSLYIRINLGWRMIQLGITVPLMDSDITNVIPDYTDHGHNPYRRPYIFRPLNSYTFNDQAQESLPESQTQIFDNTIRLYAVDEPVTGDLDGVSGADTLCYRHAQRAGVEGVFRAVLASRLQKIQSLVFTKFRHLPVVNSKGVIVLKSWEAIQDYKDNFEPLVDIYTFNGTSINTHPSWSEKYFWHGARASGHALVDQYCQAWTSSSRFESGVASTFYSGRLLDQSAHDCDSRLALLCIESHKPEPEM